MGSAVLEFMSKYHYKAEVVMLGMPDTIVEHGEQEELYAECGYDGKAIIAAAHKMMVSL
jgi:1-deoxy-D-xylulose-5-phosphate synthase